MKAGGCGFKSHLSSFYSMKIEKRALRFVAFKSLSSHVCKQHISIVSGAQTIPAYAKQQVKFL